MEYEDYEKEYEELIERYLVVRREVGKRWAIARDPDAETEPGFLEALEALEAEERWLDQRTDVLEAYLNGEGVAV